MGNCCHVLSVTMVTYEDINRILADFSGERDLEYTEKSPDSFLTSESLSRVIIQT